MVIRRTLNYLNFWNKKADSWFLTIKYIKQGINKIIMRDFMEVGKKRLYQLKNKPVIRHFFTLVGQFEKRDNDQISKKETFFESLKLSFMFFLANLFTFGFFVLAARVLGVVDYSELGVMLSIFFMFASATSLFNIIIVRHISYFIAKTQHEKVSMFCDKYVKFTAVGGVIIFLLLAALSGPISKILNLTPTNVICLGVLICSYLIWNSLIGVLNGLQYFTLLGLNKIFHAFFATLFGLLFLLIGLKAQGAIFGMALGTFLAVPLAIYSARNVFFVRPQKIGDTGLMKYLFPSAMVILCIGIMLNIDLPLVRYYLSPTESGNYAAISLIGSIVFSFATAASMVMFPKTAHFASNGRNTGFFLKKAIKYVVTMSLGLTIFYALFSKTVVNVVFGQEFHISQYIGLYTLTMSLLSISAVLIMYNLALEKRFVIYLVPIFTVIEILLIMLIHNTIWSIIILLVVFKLLFLAVLIKFSDPELSFLDKVYVKDTVKKKVEEK